MKRVFILFLAAALLLSGCGRSAVSPSPAADPGLISADALLERLLAAVPEGSEVTEAVSPEEASASLVLYGIDPAHVTACAVARLGGTRVFELAVIDLNTRSYATEAALLAYLLQRQGDFTGYAPDQALLAAQGKLFAVEQGFRLILAITGGIDLIPEALTAVGYTRIDTVETARHWLVETPPTVVPEPITTPAPEPSPEPSSQQHSGWYAYSPPNIDNMTIYDTSAIRAAWAAGSPDGLGRRDKWVYERCVEVLGQIITDDMTDYEKEWAVYYWLNWEVGYDWRHQDPSKTTPRSSFQPYGALVEGTAVCLGYATTFQLLMDLLGIECITVVGAAFRSTADHAWNMVKLNGNWYCVDVTWDLGKSSPELCSYFNVTSEKNGKNRPSVGL